MLVSDDPPFYFAFGQADLNADMVFAKERIFLFLRPHEAVQGGLCGLQHLGSNGYGFGIGGPAMTIGKNGGKTIAGEIGNESPLPVDQRYRGLKNMIEYVRQLLGALRPFAHKRLGQAGESAEVNEHGVGVEPALVQAMAIIFLDKMWQEVFQISRRCWYGVKLR